MYEYRLSTDNHHTSLLRLREIVDFLPDTLRRYSEEELSYKSSPEKWSRKEIIGHLIDSATNNHHRFVRSQFEENPAILYDQNLWNQASHYQDMEGDQLIHFWELYNRHLIELMKRIPVDQMHRTCRMSDGNAYSIAWLFDDYIRHLEHHLRQIEAALTHN